MASQSVSMPSAVSLADKVEAAGDDFSDMIDQLSTLSTVFKPGVSSKEAQAQLKSVSGRLEHSQKRINHAHQQFQKEINASMISETWAMRIHPSGADAHHALLVMICRYFERMGLASVANEMLLEDSSLPVLDLSKSLELQNLLQCLESDELAGMDTLVEWVSNNSEFLAELSSQLPTYIFELKFFRILSTGGDVEALNLLRDHCGDGILTSSTIERLAGSIPLFGTPSWSESCKYITALRRLIMSALVHDFWQLNKGVISDDHLTDILESSVVALPVLDRLSKVISLASWTSEDELPAEITLPSHLLFHPIFVCPVLKEQSSKALPKLLPCGHVLSVDAFSRLSKSHSRGLKCPYCPQTFGEQEVSDVRFIQKKFDQK